MYFKATSITVATDSTGAFGSGDMVMALVPPDRDTARIFPYSSLVLILPPSQNKRPRLLISTFGVLLVSKVVVAFLPGNLRFKAFGATKEEVNMKKMSNRKMISVRDDMLNCAETLFFFFKPNDYDLGLVAKIALNRNLPAISTTFETYLNGTPFSATIVTVTFS